jgi:hypothetical protein
MIRKLTLLWIFAFLVGSASAQVSIGIGLPHVSIGINLPVYPHLVPVPGYPVYYAPRLDSNYFFYDGMYWVYVDDNWYASSWYNGPWWVVAAVDVPLFILRVPVRYYRRPPVYFRGWHANAPPHWDEHWGRDWAQRRSGWNHWNRKAVPPPAPLPVYQRNYSGDRYPGAEQQRELRRQHYRYQPRDATVRQHYQAQRMEGPPATTRERGAQGTRRPDPAPSVRQAAPQRQQREEVQREPRMGGQEMRVQEREQGGARESGQGRGRENDRGRGGERDHDRGR